MLDVPIYGRIATLELFRPHVSTLEKHTKDKVFLEERKIMKKDKHIAKTYSLILINTLNRVKHKTFCLSQQKDTSSVFSNGMQRHLSLLQGSVMTFNLN